MIETANLTLSSHLAQGGLRLAVFAGGRCHQFAAGHIGRHGAAVVTHDFLHRTLSSRTTGCQPTNGQHSAEQQEEHCPKKFHGCDYSGDILLRRQGILTTSLAAECLHLGISSDKQVEKQR